MKANTGTCARWGEPGEEWTGCRRNAGGSWLNRRW